MFSRIRLEIAGGIRGTKNIKKNVSPYINQLIKQVQRSITKPMAKFATSSTVQE